MIDTGAPGASAEGTRGAREATTAAMLDAAEELFAAHGFTAVSVRDIGKQAGVSHALVHRYLGNKDDIYRKVLQRNEDVLLAELAGRSKGESPSCGDVDPRLVIAAVVALYLGWISLEPWLVPAAGLQD